MRVASAVLFLCGCVNFSPIRQHCPSDGPQAATCATTGDTGPEPTATQAPVIASAVITRPTLLDRNVPQGFGATPRNEAVRVQVTGSQLSAVTRAELSDGNVGVIDATTRTDSTLAIDFLVPHGAPTGAKAMQLVSPDGNATFDHVLAVTEIKVTPGATPGDTGIGAVDQPFATLAQALSVAGAGDTILLAPVTHTVGVGTPLTDGTCASAGAVNVPAGVTVRGDGGTATLSGGAVGASGQKLAGFVTSGAAVIANVDLRQFSIGVVALDGDVNLDNVTTQASLSCGVSLRGRGTAQLSNITLDTNATQGLNATKTGGALVVQSLVSTGNGGEGIALSGVFGATMSHITTSSNTGNGLVANVTTLDINGLVANDNAIGVQIEGSTRATIDMAQDGAAAPFDKGSISFNRWDDVFVRHESTLTLRGHAGATPSDKSPITGKLGLGGSPTWAGIEVDDTASVTASNLTIDKHEQQGVIVGIDVPGGKSSSLSLTSSFILGYDATNARAGQVGVYSYTAGAVVLSGVQVKGHVNRGILIDGSADTTPGSFTIEGQSRIDDNELGLQLINGSTGITALQVYQSTFIDNSTHSIYLGAPTALTARDSTLANGPAGASGAIIVAADDKARVDLGTAVVDGNNTFTCGDGYIISDQRSAAANTQHTMGRVLYYWTTTGAALQDSDTNPPGCIIADQLPFIRYATAPTADCNTRGLRNR